MLGDDSVRCMLLLFHCSQPDCQVFFPCSTVSVISAASAPNLHFDQVRKTALPHRLRSINNSYLSCLGRLPCACLQEDTVSTVISSLSTDHGNRRLPLRSLNPSHICEHRANTISVQASRFQSIQNMADQEMGHCLNTRDIWEATAL